MRIQSLPTALGLIAFATLGLHITACGENAAEGGSSEAASGAPNSATGGASAEKNTTTTKTSGKGGTSAKSSASGRGGQKQTSEAVEEGGSSGSTDEPQNEGGASEEPSQGGSSAKTRTSAAGGATSKSSSTKGSGGTASSSTKATGGSAATTTKAAGGASTKATGGASATTGGASSSAAGGATGNPSAEKFSFFVISYKAIIELSGTDKGFGGDLRYGETGDKAGLRGADKICAKVAESSMPNNGKTWRAFLSTSYENAIDRIGEGPWYDRRGRVFAMKKADLLSTRPTGADSAIVNDFPNENGVTNHNPDGTGDVDNHDFLTGSGKEGKIYKSTATCSDWTNAEPDTSKKPRVGHSWPRKGMSFPGMGGDTGGSTTNVEGMEHWISALDESGCGPGQYQPTAGQFDGPPGNDGVVGSGGGYGGWYCFALTP